ncbi:MAG TPA: IS701 family transposase [Anaerolineales bacterium]
MTVRIGRAVPPPSGRAPVLNIAPRDVEGMGDELKRFHQMFASGFVRREQRHWALKYSQGQLLELERKSIEPMAVAVAGGNIQAMQQFISQGTWSDDEVLAIHRRAVAETLGHPDGVAILDGCDFPKQGRDSVGVAPQYCGPLGKIANCQASVVLAYASERGATLLDRRLYLPRDWFGAEHRDRWLKCGIPEDVAFKTKPTLGAEMLTALIAEGTVPFRWVTMDEGYGTAGYLLDLIDRENKLFFAEMPRDKQAWLRRPKLVPPQVRASTGRPPTRTHLAPDASPAQRVDAIALQWRPTDWQRFIIHEGSKGPLEVEIAVRRVVMADEELPGRDEWLVVRRPIGQMDPKYWKFFRSNTPADTPLTTLARMTAWRWPVESVIEECKGELGLDHYEVRGWVGWHHHTTMTLLAHHFLMRLRVNRGIEAPALTVAQVRKLLQVVLPKREFNAQEALDELARIQRQNYGAYRSHKKRRRRAAKSSPPN